MLRQIAVVVGSLLAGVAATDAMTFTWPDHLTVHASGPIEKGDAARFAALPRFATLELDSPADSSARPLR
jgi:hypothetical protein